MKTVLVLGGGSAGTLVANRLRERLPGVPLRTFEELGWRSKDRETLAFALMGYAAWFGLPNTLPSATGARRAVVAGRVARP